MKTRLLFTAAIAFLLAMGFQSCHDDDNPAPTKPSMEDLKIPDGFTFESTREVTVTVKMPDSVSFEDMRSRFDIYTANPSEGGKLITSGSFDVNGQWTGEIRVPTALQEIYVETIAGAVTVSIAQGTGTKEGGVIIDFGDDYGYTPPDTTEPDMKSLYAGGVQAKNSTALLKGRNNLVGNADFENDDFGTIQYWSSSHPVDGRWYFTQYTGSMEWYDDGGNHVIRTPMNNTGGWYHHYYGGAAQMIDASPSDVVTFSADIKGVGNSNSLYAYLYLIPVNSSNHPLGYYCVRYYHPGNSWVNKTVVATMPSGTAHCKILIWTHDYSNTASVYVDNVVVTGPVTDSDGDGVDDDLDDYPDDPDRAFNVFYPNSTDWGTFAYEDLWPGKGDYDFNDLILDYHFKSVLNSNNELVEFFTDYSVRAVGASLENGFGFMLGGDPSNVASVTGTNLTENYISLAANGTEQGQTNTVIILFDNAFENIGSSGSTFINTKPDIPYVDPDTSQLHVLYATPVSVTTTGTAPYNPFLIVDKDRGKEVHLAGKEPTDLVDTSYFGQWFDDSDPATGKYYQSATNLPWAIDLPVAFDYPVEQVQILNAYTHFQQWAESGGSDYPDWYKDLSGYCVTENIYSPPGSNNK
jgi:LruC domain-containing protein